MSPLIKQRKQDDNAPMTLPGVATATAPTHTEEWAVPFSMDLSGNARVVNNQLVSGEDTVVGVTKVEQRFTYSVPITASAAIKAAPGFLHALIFSQNDAAPTAGTIDVYDNASAASGNKIFSWTLTTTVFMPFSVILDVTFSAGLYVSITTTNDVNVSASYR